MKIKKHLYWAITGSCQLRCRYCFYETGMIKRPVSSVDASHARRVIPQLTSHFAEVTLTGGETLLNVSFWDIVRMARSAGMAVCFLTDGIRLDAACVDQALRHGVTRVAISLDSLDIEVNESLRSPRALLNSTTETIIENVMAMAKRPELRLPVTVIQTVCRSNIDSVRPMIQFCRRLELDLLIHPAGMPSSCPHVSDIRLESCSPKEKLELERAMLEWADGHEARTKYTRLAMSFVRGQTSVEVACPMGSRHFFLDADGTLSPCFHRRDLQLGNIYDTDLQVLLGRRIPEELRAAPCANLACACMLE